MVNGATPAPPVDAGYFVDTLSGIQMMLPELTLHNIISLICQGAMVFGGVFPFVPQYIDIKRSGNAEGFSLFVCLNLLIANILRILFWFGRRFELPLLAQSIIMVVTMMMLVELCVRVKSKSEILASKQHKLTDSKSHQRNEEYNLSTKYQSSHSKKESRFFDFDPQYFWRWSDLASYVEFLTLFTFVMGFLTWLFLDSVYFVETIGFLAVFAEAMLGAPQFYRNFVNKSTQGMSWKMVCMWTCGDIFKTGYFILREAPAQFWVCGMLQVSIDIMILLQVCIYRHKPAIS